MFDHKNLTRTNLFSLSFLVSQRMRLHLNSNTSKVRRWSCNILKQNLEMENCEGHFDFWYNEFPVSSCFIILWHFKRNWWSIRVKKMAGVSQYIIEYYFYILMCPFTYEIIIDVANLSLYYDISKMRLWMHIKLFTDYGFMICDSEITFVETIFDWNKVQSR